MVALTVHSHVARSSLHVSGTIRVPGDKSISHRSLIFSALAPGISHINNILNSADVRATARVLKALGASIPELTDSFDVHGTRHDRLHSPFNALDCANSGTTARLLMGVVAGLEGRRARFTGDASLSKRPMRRIAQPLVAMGARVDFEGGENHFGLPVQLFGARLHTLNWHNEHSSAQVKSAILLAALVSGVEAGVTEPHRSRDHTERMLQARGVNIDVNDQGVRIMQDQSLSALDVEVPGDPSSATFFVALAALAGSGQLRLVDVCLNPSRIGALMALRRMGAVVQLEDERSAGGEPVGTIVVSAGTLVSTEISGEEIPALIDELPMIACVATCADGETRVTGASELRVKESDRITAVVDNLRAIGADADELPDGFIVRGHQRALSGRVVTFGDHRLAMAFGVLGALPGNNIVVDNPDCVDVSFPAFWKELHKATSSSRSLHDTPSPRA